MKEHNSLIVFLAAVLITIASIPCGLYGGVKSAIVGGYAYLQDQSDHSGISVIFTAQSPSAVTDTFYTNSAGYFAAGLSEGLYSVKYEKEHYVTIELPDNILFDESTTLESVTLQGPYIELSGNISGTLENSYQYLVINNIYVQSDDTLNIQAGCIIKFYPGKSFNIYGKLFLNGNSNDTITFTSLYEQPSINDKWKGINCWASNTIFNYCKIEYGGICFYNDSLTLSNSLVKNCAVYISNYSV